jgi:hypothetical protein
MNDERALAGNFPGCCWAHMCSANFQEPNCDHHHTHTHKHKFLLSRSPSNAINYTIKQTINHKFFFFVFKLKFLWPLRAIPYSCGSKMSVFEFWILYTMDWSVYKKPDWHPEPQHRAHTHTQANCDMKVMSLPFDNDPVELSTPNTTSLLLPYRLTIFALPLHTPQTFCIACGFLRSKPSTSTCKNLFAWSTVKNINQYKYKCEQHIFVRLG